MAYLARTPPCQVRGVCPPRPPRVALVFFLSVFAYGYLPECAAVVPGLPCVSPYYAAVRLPYIAKIALPARAPGTSVRARTSSQLSYP